MNPGDPERAEQLREGAPRVRPQTSSDPERAEQLREGAPRVRPQTSSDPGRAELLRERVRRLLPQVLADSARAELRLQTAERLLPQVLADAATAGFRPQVDLDLSEGGDVEMTVWYAPGHRGGGTSGSRPTDPDDEAEVLAWIADEVQEATMEGDHSYFLVWPVCSRHGLGGHAVVAEERAVWWCNGDAGHVIARIGELGRHQV